jgi:hypothetical protein
MKTQEDKILELLNNARINGLRKRFGCSCKNNNTICFATEHIINKRLEDNSTVFMYRETKPLLQEYREEHKKAKKKYPGLILFDTL